MKESIERIDGSLLQAETVLDSKEPYIHVNNLRESELRFCHGIGGCVPPLKVLRTLSINIR